MKQLQMKQSYKNAEILEILAASILGNALTRTGVIRAGRYKNRAKFLMPSHSWTKWLNFKKYCQNEPKWCLFKK